MSRTSLEVADIFRDHGAAFRAKHRGHIRLGAMKVMSAIERCRTAALGGHVTRCDACAHIDVAYNSCRNRHCPKCQGAVAKQWLEDRKRELLPVTYFHVVFTVPSHIGDIAHQNQALLYELLFKVSAQTLLTIGADPKHLGAHLGLTAVLHTWGSAMTHHPHIHCIVPGGGLALDGERWVHARPRFLVSVKVLSALFKRLFLERLRELYREGQLQLLGKLEPLNHPHTFNRLLARLKQRKWYVHARPPFAGPEAVLEYLSRYTHRVAIANSRLIDFDDQRVTFRWKDYRASDDNRYKTMSLATHEFIRRFLIHVLPKRFHRIRHYGLFANAQRHRNIHAARALLHAQQPPDDERDDNAKPLWLTCSACGATMRIIERFEPLYSTYALRQGRDPP